MQTDAALFWVLAGVATAYIVFYHCNNSQIDEIFLDTTPVTVFPGQGGWFEGPVWTNGALLFSDTITDRIYKFDPVTEQVSVFLTGTGGCADCNPTQLEPGSNGMAAYKNHVLVCQHGAQQLSFLDVLNKSFTTALHRTSNAFNKPFNSPNDVVLATTGWAYFTDPPYGFLKKENPYDGPHLDTSSSIGFSGLFRFKITDKRPQAELLDDTIKRPNGIGLSPNGTQLYVSECIQLTPAVARWYTYDIDQSAGTLHNKRKWEHRVSGPLWGKGCADGLTVHPKTGHVIASCPGGAVCVLDGHKGTMLGTISFPGKASNVIVGADNYLYVTGDALWRLPLVA